MSDRQHGESGAPLPRHLAKQHGRGVCNAHNSEDRLKGWIHPISRRPKDATGTFTVETKPKPKRLKKPK